ncbi:hypothetical protein DSO57_1000935 [Entomophthora muscae]|uniref:Uncharacterized protein n=2 Tax=Entomophthora muscae TaxID=34485 RepID=A0ACC2SHB2_9FUNG|nr:hypothetical protein DSO57_1018246 [Entomophthora muscae]KAJ9074996.1 hypothetical protein DSO57_1000935 [Entomophthora muscae]
MLDLEKRFSANSKTTLLKRLLKQELSVRSSRTIEIFNVTRCKEPLLKHSPASYLLALADPIARLVCRTRRNEHLPERNPCAKGFKRRGLESDLEFEAMLMFGFRMGKANYCRTLALTLTPPIARHQLPSPEPHF